MAQLFLKLINDNTGQKRLNIACCMCMLFVLHIQPLFHVFIVFQV